MIHILVGYRYSSRGLPQRSIVLSGPGQSEGRPTSLSRKTFFSVPINGPNRMGIPLPGFSLVFMVPTCSGILLCADGRHPGIVGPRSSVDIHRSDIAHDD